MTSGKSWVYFAVTEPSTSVSDAIISSNTALSSVTPLNTSLNTLSLEGVLNARSGASICLALVAVPDKVLNASEAGKAAVS